MFLGEDICVAAPESKPRRPVTVTHKSPEGATTHAFACARRQRRDHKPPAHPRGVAPRQRWVA